MTGLVSFESNKRRRRTTLTTFLFVCPSDVSTCYLPNGDGTTKEHERTRENQRKEKRKEGREKKRLSNLRRSLSRSNDRANII